MWFKYGLKAQKLLGASALSGRVGLTCETGRVGQNLRNLNRLFINKLKNKIYDEKTNDDGAGFADGSVSPGAG